MNARPTTVGTAVERSVLLADVARAASVVAPYWPLTSFVAVNPLGGLQDRPFADATAAARSWFGATTHLPPSAYRAEHAAGRISGADLDRAVDRALDRIGPVGSLDRDRAVDIVRWDLVAGPVGHPVRRRDDPVASALDELLTSWCATFVDEAHVPWAMPGRDRGFYAAWRELAPGDRRLRAVIGRTGRAALEQLPEDPADLIAAAFDHAGVGDDVRVPVLRSMLLRTPGWASYARWCDDWAPADHAGPRLRMLDLVAVRVAMAHLAPGGIDGYLRTADRPADEPTGAVVTDPADPTLADRVTAAVTALDLDSALDESVADLLARLPDERRQAIWLDAHEWSIRDRLLARLDGPPAPSNTDGRGTSRPDAQLVFCIDVRSEGLRRHLESLGSYETFGFAGFFGVPVRWRPLGASAGQARCPVLVSPRHEVVEVAVADDRPYLSACATTAGLHDAFYAAKGGIGSPFALAESAGWFTGPIAAVRTLAPPRTPTDPERPRSWWRRATAAPATAPMVDDTVGAAHHSGLSVEERTLFAEAIVTTIGMTRFAPLVVLCGHGSRTVNNPHASSLDCGACGGAPGGASARIAVAILNDPAVREELVERGIAIPDDTLFVAAEHDTTADVVTLFDLPTSAGAHASCLARLQADLLAAGERNARDRARRLPGNPDRVRDRGRDWAQVRPEWALAGNAAFVIGPRSITAGRDLGGRAFLHSYDAELDPDGVALETIMTAPLVVAQWISAQYYFSTVDLEVFGAGDKMLHNPVGGIGVIVGQSGDLAVGLPLQSVMFGEQRAHDPVRLLAIVQAPHDRIDGIVDRNPGLRQLVDGEWIHVVARPDESAPWSVRLASGTWTTWQPGDVEHAAAAPLLTPLELS
jgi:hypothetical protein